MNITCPYCQTVFGVDQKVLLKKSNIKVKCSVCKNVWTHSPKPINSEKKGLSYTKLIVLNITVILTFIISLFIFKNDYLQLGGYWLQIYMFIQNLVPIQ